MGNGNGPYVHPEWQIGKLYPVNVPFVLLGERAIISQLHADMYSGDVNSAKLEVRINYPDRPSWKNIDVVVTKAKPTEDVFWLPLKFYSKEELIEAIRAKEQERISKRRDEEVREQGIYVQRMKKRYEIDDLVGKVVEGLGTTSV